jgi:hypothetical protein
MRVAGQVDDRAHRDARQRQVDDELRQALVPVFRLPEVRTSAIM